MGLKDRSTEIKHGLPGHLLGPVPLPTSLESKVSPSHQALLQHLLQKEQIRQQKMISSGKMVASFLSVSTTFFSKKLAECNRSLFSSSKVKARCHPTLTLRWPWRIVPPAVVLSYQNTDPWTEPSRPLCLRTRWPNLSSSSNTSTSWRNRNSTSSRFT